MRKLTTLTMRITRSVCRICDCLFSTFSANFAAGLRTLMTLSSKVISHPIILGDCHHILGGIHAFGSHPFGVDIQTASAPVSSPWHKTLVLLT